MGKDQEPRRTNKLLIFKQNCNLQISAHDDGGPWSVQRERKKEEREEEKKDKEERETNAINSGPLVLCIASHASRSDQLQINKKPQLGFGQDR